MLIERKKCEIDSYYMWPTFLFALIPGRGVVTKKTFHKGAFLLEYVGEVISWTEGERRQRKKSEENFKFYFHHKGKKNW